MIDNGNFGQQVKELIFYLDDVEGNKLYKQIKKTGQGKFENNPEIRESFLTLQFLIIPYLEIEHIASLFKNDLYIGLGIEDLDLSERINKKLMLINLEERDGYKRQLRQALLDSKEKITAIVEISKDKKLSTASSWLNDYISSINPAEKGLGRAKYFFEKTYYRNLSSEEKERLNNIFSLYEFLSRSSLSPLGFEDDMLLKTEDGKLITTNKGEVIVLHDYKTGESFRPEESKVRRVSGPPRTQEEKNIDKLIKHKQEIKEQPFASKVIDEEINNRKRIEELKIMANKYKDNSLQKRAIEEEIRKLERR